jgi:cytidine deaminase
LKPIKKRQIMKKLSKSAQNTKITPDKKIKNGLTDAETKEMIKRAISVRLNAYDPVTNFGVGACILTTDGYFFEGCNVQSVISGLGTCAERSAVDHAVTHGKYKYKAISVVAEKAIMPCGACLQYLNEFSQITNKDIVIISANSKGKIKSTTSLHKLAGKLYGPKDGHKDLSKYK